MSLWSTLRTAVQTVAPVATPAKPKPRAPSRDPWYNDLARRRAVNTRRGATPWLGDTSTWWQRDRRRELDW